MEEDRETGLRKQKELADARAARKALDHGNPARALSLVKNVENFWPQNLITLMGIIGFHSDKRDLVIRAHRLFNTQLQLCTKAGALIQLAAWAHHPKRSASIPTVLKEAIDRQWRTLDPDWDGSWDDGGTSASNKALAITKLDPSQVTSPDDCLLAVAQVGTWGPWLNRYHQLGGSTENPQYLKIIVAKAVSRELGPTARIKGLLKKFTQVGKVSEVRKFLRHITPTHDSPEGINPNHKLAEYALMLYCHYSRIEHTLDDWVHIAESALHLDHYVVARTVQRILVDYDDDPRADVILRRLAHKYGPISKTGSPRDDIGPKGNPIWGNIFPLIPVNEDARKILASYSGLEL
jgi:hypothetical protein